ncbi:Aspartyl-tRNA(Asn) amidotransferase subunit C @ Glutamyl-tRNA(Gln) amidotransferase subunit C [hydrothermal vent metagenome]|uniref:Aspartyl-tRNA(Asn) amidotransferase subunit C @ Glutamyl-tRNA(Gln) amidotransferase subunit C n=1 Tax=hydrothermal vent metagenome TaxID=652676 RepID=A0A1W1D1S8_9ZZZZ
MTIDNRVLENLEKLSMLKIEDSKKEELANQLTEILEYIENLKELDTDHLDATFSTLAGGTPMREDTPKSNPQVAKDIFSHAPNAQNDFFIVPKIIE